MLGGVINLAGDIAAFLRGGTKIAMGLNPNQPLDIWAWLKQISQGKAILEDARSEYSAPPIMDHHAAPIDSGIAAKRK